MTERVSMDRANTYCMERIPPTLRLCQNKIPMDQRVCADCKERKEKEKEKNGNRS